MSSYDRVLCKVTMDIYIRLNMSARVFYKHNVVGIGDRLGSVGFPLDAFRIRIKYIKIGNKREVPFKILIQEATINFI